jgi:hypothetical protein
MMPAFEMLGSRSAFEEGRAYVPADGDHASVLRRQAR